MRTLDSLPPGGWGIIQGLHAPGRLRARLLALGFTPGTRVRRLASAPWGEPTAYRLRGFTLALGRAQARQIELAPPCGEGRGFLPL